MAHSAAVIFAPLWTALMVACGVIFAVCFAVPSNAIICYQCSSYGLPPPPPQRSPHSPLPVTPHDPTGCYQVNATTPLIDCPPSSLHCLTAYGIYAGQPVITRGCGTTLRSSSSSSSSSSDDERRRAQRLQAATPQRLQAVLRSLSDTGCRVMQLAISCQCNHAQACNGQPFLDLNKRALVHLALAAPVDSNEFGALEELQNEQENQLSQQIAAQRSTPTTTPTTPTTTTTFATIENDDNNNNNVEGRNSNHSSRYARVLYTYDANGRPVLVAASSEPALVSGQANEMDYTGPNTSTPALLSDAQAEALLAEARRRGRTTTSTARALPADDDDDSRRRDPPPTAANNVAHSEQQQQLQQLVPAVPSSSVATTVVATPTTATSTAPQAHDDDDDDDDRRPMFLAAAPSFSSHVHFAAAAAAAHNASSDQNPSPPGTSTTTTTTTTQKYPAFAALNSQPLEPVAVRRNTIAVGTTADNNSDNQQHTKPDPNSETLYRGVYTNLPLIDAATSQPSLSHDDVGFSSFVTYDNHVSTTTTTAPVETVTVSTTASSSSSNATAVFPPTSGEPDQHHHHQHQEQQTDLGSIPRLQPPQSEETTRAAPQHSTENASTTWRPTASAFGVVVAALMHLSFVCQCVSFSNTLTI